MKYLLCLFLFIGCVPTKLRTRTIYRFTNEGHSYTCDERRDRILIDCEDDATKEKFKVIIVGGDISILEQEV